MLAFAQPGQQHDLSVPKLQGIVMPQRVTLVDLTEASYFLPSFVAAGTAPDVVVLSFVFKSDLCAGSNTHRHVWFSNFGAATGGRNVEPCRYQLVRDLCAVSYTHLRAHETRH